MNPKQVKIPLGGGKLLSSLLNRANSDHFVIYPHRLANHTGRTLPFSIAQHMQQLIDDVTGWLKERSA